MSSRWRLCSTWGFDIGYGWWTPAASTAKPLMDAKVRHEDPKKGLHDVRSFIGACNFYRRHIKNFTYTSAILTDLIKKSQYNLELGP